MKKLEAQILIAINHAAQRLQRPAENSQIEPLSVEFRILGEPQSVATALDGQDRKKRDPRWSEHDAVDWKERGFIHYPRPCNQLINPSDPNVSFRVNEARPSQRNESWPKISHSCVPFSLASAQILPLKVDPDPHPHFIFVKVLTYDTVRSSKASGWNTRGGYWFLLGLGPAQERLLDLTVKYWTEIAKHCKTWHESLPSRKIVGKYLIRSCWRRGKDYGWFEKWMDGGSLWKELQIIPNQKPPLCLPKTDLTLAGISWETDRREGEVGDHRELGETE